jgi:hypothetical protein
MELLRSRQYAQSYLVIRSHLVVYLSSALRLWFGGGNSMVKIENGTQIDFHFVNKRYASLECE